MRKPDDRIGQAIHEGPPRDRAVRGAEADHVRGETYRQFRRNGAHRWTPIAIRRGVEPDVDGRGTDRVHLVRGSMNPVSVRIQVHVLCQGGCYEERSYEEKTNNKPCTRDHCGAPFRFYGCKAGMGTWRWGMPTDALTPWTVSVLLRKRPPEPKVHVRSTQRGCPGWGSPGSRSKG